MDKFNYLGVMITAGCGILEEVAHRVLEGMRQERYVGRSQSCGKRA